MANNWEDFKGLHNCAPQNGTMDTSLKTAPVSNMDLLLDYFDTPQQTLPGLEMVSRQCDPVLPTSSECSDDSQMAQQSQQQQSLRQILQTPKTEPLKTTQQPRVNTTQSEQLQQQLYSNEQQMQLLHSVLTTQQQQAQQMPPQHLVPNEALLTSQNNQMQELLKQLIGTQLTLLQTSAGPPAPIKTAPNGSPFIAVTTSANNRHNAKPYSKPVGRRVCHTETEKKYRDKLTQRLNDLKGLVCGFDVKVTKETILSNAMNRIAQLEKENSRLRQEVTSLRQAQLQRDTISQLMKLQWGNQRAMQALQNPPIPIPCGGPEEEREMYPARSLSPESASSLKSDYLSDSTESLPSDSYPLKDRTRVCLCSFLIIFLFFSPLNMLLPMSRSDALFSSASSEFSQMHGGSRTLSSVDSPQPSAMLSWAVIVSIKWLVNVVLVIGVLVRIFVFGEPVTRPHSDRAVLFWRHKNQADIYLAKGDSESAAQQLETCLRVLGRTVPVTRLDVVWGLMWHSLRHVLHRLGIGRRLASSVCRVFFRQVNEDIHKEFDKINARDAAIVYHKLLQLSLSGRVPRGYWRASVLGLSAINLAETAGSFISDQMMSRMYVTAAMQIKQTLPRKLTFISRYFLLRARDTCTANGATIPYAMQWLFQPQGHRFFVSSKWSCKGGDSMWASVANHADPLVNISHEFRQHLLEKALTATLFPKDTSLQSHSKTSDSADMSGGCMDAMNYLNMLDVCAEAMGESPEGSVDEMIGSVEVLGCSAGVLDCTTRNVTGSSVLPGCPTQSLCGSGGIPEASSCLLKGPAGLLRGNMGRSGDEVAKWWAAVGMVATHWLRGEDEAAERFYSTVESVPETLLDTEDPIAKALLLAFKARREILHAKHLRRKKTAKCLQLCNKSGMYLRESIILASQQADDISLASDSSTSLASSRTANRLSQLVQLLCCDWLLATRTDIWEANRMPEYVLHRAMDSAVLASFQHDLESLQKIMHGIQAALPRMYLYEAVSRFMAGANPAETERLLQRCTLKQRIVISKPSENTTNQPGAGVEECVTGERERAAALMMACRYLPQPFLSAPGQRKEMLMEAARSLERLGDKRTLQDCKQLLRQLKY